MTKKILFASVLKPCNDTRMYAKMAEPLLSEGYDVHVAGFETNFLPKSQVTFHFINKGNRFSFNRFFAGINFILLCFKLKPNLIVVCTHELLFPVLIYKFLSKVKFVYDIQENYFYNILFTNAFSKYIRFLLAKYIQIKELIVVKFATSIILAEFCYENELKHLLKNSNYKVFPNYFLNNKNYPNQCFNIDNQYHLVYSGTIAPHYGIENAILFAQKLLKIQPKVKLTIIGFCADENYRKYILNKYQNLQFIHWIGIDKLVAHEQIILTMLNAHAVLLPYLVNKSTKFRVPTKVYECLSLGIPVIINQTQQWTHLFENDNSLIVNFEELDSIDYQIILDTLNSLKLSLNNNYKWNIESWKVFLTLQLL